MSHEATVVITTKNRREELRVALASTVTQEPPVEILVIDDGSTDGTSEMVKRDFPVVRLTRSECSLGYVVQRNRAAKVARAPIIVSIDDDAEFSSSRTVAQAVSCFDAASIGAVALPFVNVNSGPAICQAAPYGEPGWALSTFIGTAYAVRRKVFLDMGGFRECFVHQGEEEDFCIRLLERGLWVRAGSGDPVLHRESRQRSYQRMDYYGKRNLLLFYWCNVPWRHLALNVPVTIINALRHTVKIGRYGPALRGLVNGMAAPIFAREERAPVRSEVYRAFRWLKTIGPARAGELLARTEK